MEEKWKSEGEGDGKRLRGSEERRRLRWGGHKIDVMII
jgi:hypothetical protein